jgi:nucleoid-associated protein YgaU
VGLTLSTATATTAASARSASTVAVVATDTSNVATMRVVDQPPAEAAEEAPSATWTIAPGDHLWGLARDALTQHGLVADDANVAAYVAAIVERNRHRLAVPSDPDLIFPGQVFERPPIG